MEQTLSVAMSEKPGLAKWIQALRPWSFPASLVPAAVGALAALGRDGAAWGLFPLIALSIVCLHAGTNLVNDYYDYDLGVDRLGALGGSGVLVSGELSARQIGRAAVASFVSAVAFGVPLVLARGWPVVALGVAGLLGGALYTAKPVQYKYFGAGDLLVFLLLGPLSVVGSYFTITGAFSVTAALASVPVGLLVTAILHVNNLRDLELDAEFELKTLAIRLGRKRSVVYLRALLLAAYGVLGGAVISGALPPHALLAVATVPLALRLSAAAAALRPGQSEPDVVKMAGGLQTAFGLLLCLGLFLARFVVLPW